MNNSVTLNLTVEQLKALVNLLGPLDEITVNPDVADAILKLLQEKIKGL